MRMSGPTTSGKGTGVPIVLFECGPSSYTFDQRTVHLAPNGTPTKTGRSQGPLKPKPDNAIFECRVLSRTHAQIWYQDGSFFLKDTGSSNGTFVNGKKINDNEKQGLKYLFSLLHFLCLRLFLFLLLLGIGPFSIFLLLLFLFT